MTLNLHEYYDFTYLLGFLEWLSRKPVSESFFVRKALIKETFNLFQMPTK